MYAVKNFGQFNDISKNELKTAYELNYKESCQFFLFFQLVFQLKFTILNFEFAFLLFILWQQHCIHLINLTNANIYKLFPNFFHFTLFLTDKLPLCVEIQIKKNTKNIMKYHGNRQIITIYWNNNTKKLVHNLKINNK